MILWVSSGLLLGGLLARELPRVSVSPSFALGRTLLQSGADSARFADRAGTCFFAKFTANKCSRAAFLASLGPILAASFVGLLF